MYCPGMSIANSFIHAYPRASSSSLKCNIAIVMSIWNEMS